MKKIASQINKHKNLLNNFTYLSVLKIFNILIPLITITYFIKVLGKETYGLIVLAQAIMSYFVILVNFGLNTLATKEISVSRENKLKINEITSLVFSAKIILFFISILILSILLVLIEQTRGYETLFFLSMWVCLYDVIFPIWYFRGIEKMKFIAYLTITSRLIFLVLTFLLIKSEKNYLLVPIINGIGALFSGILALFILFGKDEIKFKVPMRSDIWDFIKKSVPFFISEISIKFFASSNKVIIGVFLGLTNVTYYDFAEKIINVFRSVPLGIVVNTIYPRVAKTKDITIVRKTTIIMSVYALLAVFLLNVFGSILIKMIGGEEMLPSLILVRILSILIFTTHLSNYYITVGLWSLNYEKIFRNMMIFSGLIFFVIYLILWLFNSINLYTITITPIIVDIYLIIHIYSFFKKINNEKAN